MLQSQGRVRAPSCCCRLEIECKRGVGITSWGSKSTAARARQGRQYRDFHSQPKVTIFMSFNRQGLRAHQRKNSFKIRSQEGAGRSKHSLHFSAPSPQLIFALNEAGNCRGHEMWQLLQGNVLSLHCSFSPAAAAKWGHAPDGRERDGHFVYDKRDAVSQPP